MRLRTATRSLLLAACLLAGCSLPQAAEPAEPSAPVPTQAPVVTATPAPTRTASPTPDPSSLNVQEFIERCPSPEEIAAIDADLEIAFEHDPNPGTLLCEAADGSVDLTKLQLRAYQVLLVMKRLEFDQPLPWTDLPLYEWFTSTIHGIRFRNDITYSYCCEPIGTINLKTSLEALHTNRWLSYDYRSESIQSLMVLMIHEARHSQGYPHTCGTLDTTLAEMGAFGVQYWTYVWLAYHSDPDFMTDGGAQPNRYRAVNRDQAVHFLDAREVGAGPFCGEATRTPGPTPTVP